jgi:hypothetical protein
MAPPSNSQQSRTQYQGRARVNHVDAQEAQQAPGVVLGEFLVEFTPATVLFMPALHRGQTPKNSFGHLNPRVRPSMPAQMLLGQNSFKWGSVLSRLNRLAIPRD